MKNYKYLAIAVAATVFAACSNDENLPGNDPNSPVAARVTAGISQTLTRVSLDNDGAAAFTAGDKINVVAGGAQTYVYALQDDGTWQPDGSPYYFQDRNNVTFRAWYADPNVTVENNAISIDTKTQEYNTESGWNYHDILVTPVVSASASSPSVSFTGNNAFGHIMSQLVFTFKAGDGIADLSALTGYTLKGIVTDATFDTQTLTRTNGSTSGDIAITGISGVTGTEYTCAPIILVPQPFTSSQLDLEVTYNGQTYKATLNVPEGDQLQSGYSYTYTVTINNTELEVGNAIIKDWITLIGFNGMGNATLQ